MVSLAQGVITGAVVDSETGDSIPYATVRYKGHKVVVRCDSKGEFSIPRHNGWKLQFSVVGYKPSVINVTESLPSKHVDARLLVDDNSLSELVVSSKKSKYSRKENPAVELMRRVIAAKKQNKLENNDFYSYKDYQKLKFAINDLNPSDLDKGLFKNQKWLLNQLEVCNLSNKLILPVMIEEKVSREIYRKSSDTRKSIIEAEHSSGLNDIFETGDIVNVMVKDVFSTIDIYDDQVRFLRQRFTSPIGKDAIAFYRFYIVDTLKVDRDSCIHLTFIPNNQQDFGFRGDLYVVKDSSLHVKKVTLGIPKASNVNFVDNMMISQEYVRLDDGNWVLSQNDMLIELSIVGAFTKMAVVRQSRLSNYDFSPIDSKLFKGKVDEIIDPDAGMRDAAYWAKYRGTLVDSGGDTNMMDQFLVNLKKIKGFGWVAWTLKAFLENYIETCPTGSKSMFDIGPVNTLISQNEMDGMRFRMGGSTTANLNQHLFFEGYVAHGMKTNKNYYKGKLTYSFNRKRYSENEFPRRSISIASTYDICSPSDRFVKSDKDNMFGSFKWSKVLKMMFYNRQTVEFVREQDNGLKFKANMKFEEDEATGGLLFKNLSQYGDRPYEGGNWEQYYEYDKKALHNGKMRTTELFLEIEYSPGAKYFNTKQRQLPVNREAPVFTLSHTIGLKGIAGGQYSYHATEAKIFKRFFLNSWGILNTTVNGGYQWSQVPYPLLMAPAANMSYIITNETFNLINNSEFMNDRYVSAFVSWEPNGKIFNRIPLLKKLKWREYIGVRTLWGGLSDKNNPALQSNWDSNILMAFPEGYYAMNPREPYVEGIVGIHNVLKFFNFDYVRRFNYVNLPTAHKHGFRFAFRFTF